MSDTDDEFGWAIVEVIEKARKAQQEHEQKHDVQLELPDVQRIHNEIVADFNAGNLTEDEFVRRMKDEAGITIESEEDDANR